MKTDAEDIPAPDFNVDYSTILPIQQKRTIAFVNNFIMNTVSFLNTFARSCESKLMEFESKVQRVEANLVILESQLASIQGLDDKDDVVVESTNSTVELPSIIPESSDLNDTVDGETTIGVVACRDPRFVQFFKMLQVGVPRQAVKNKMVIEGLDPTVLDKPNEVIPNN